MTSPKTINPSNLFQMSKQGENVQSFDSSKAPAFDMDFDDTDFNIDNYIFGGLPTGLHAGSGYDESSVQEPVSTVDYVTANNFQSFAKAPQQVFSTQQIINPPPAMLAPTQVLPTPPPGLAYHPQVGWYYPAQAPTAGSSAGFQTPPFVQPTMNAPQAIPQIPHFTEASAPPVPLFNEPSAVQTSTNDKKRGSSRVSPHTKRKYGPSAYLEEQAKRRAEGDDSGPRPVTRDSVDFHYDSRLKSIRTSPRAAAKQMIASPSTFKYQSTVELTGKKMQELKAATAQKCSCPEAVAVEKESIPRPRNAFIIFRNDFAARWRTSHGEKKGLKNPDISKEAGKAWESLKQKDKAAWGKYKARAVAEKDLHEKRNPGYKYMPLKKIQARFGQPDCSCGAYEMNLAELQRLRDGAPTPENNFTGVEASGDGNSEYIRPRTRSQSRANIYRSPTAQMFTFDFNEDMPDFDFTFHDQNTSVEWENVQASNATIEDKSEQPPTKKRRSARTTSSKIVHYAEASGDEADEDVEMAFTTPRKHRPSPISTSRKPSSQFSEINSADFKVFVNEDEEGPAARTRSKSISDVAMAEPGTSTSNDSSMGSLFDDEETIAVATSKTKLVLPGSGARETRSQSRGRKRRRS